MSTLAKVIVTLYLSSLATLTRAAAMTTTQYTTTSTVSTTLGPATHTVLVGAGGDAQFHPNSINANPGDTISFQFYPTKHSVVRGVYTGSEACGNDGCNPCVPAELIDPTVAPFSSGNFLTQDLPDSANLAVSAHRRLLPVD
jgi:plastocyanin